MYSPSIFTLKVYLWPLFVKSYIGFQIM
uniref:Uncharacterized protein n=1 Tax=Rhizophora mucronata TaxID=61149 RepID=A0A2P2JAZ0_RHIMU